MTKTISLLISFALILILLSGCNKSQTQTLSKSISPDSSVTISPTSSYTSNISAPATGLSSSTPAQSHPAQTAPMPGIPQPSIMLAYIPRLGEITDMTFTVTVKTSDLGMIGENENGLVNARAYVVFYWTNIHGSYSEAKHSVQVPPEEVIISGDISWQGNALENSTIELHSKVKFSREGIWGIQGNIIGDGWKKPVAGGTRIAIADGTSCKFAHDTASLRPTPHPLDYLKNFNYGGYGYRILNDLNNRIIIDPDISKVPLVGEEADISIGITSLYDVPDFSARVKFWNKQKGVWTPGSDLLVSGNLNWYGDLKAGQPVNYSAKIKFPEEGKWEIYTEGQSLNDALSNHIRDADSIYLTIGSIRSFYGWEPDFSQLRATNSKQPAPTSTP